MHYVAFEGILLLHAAATGMLLFISYFLIISNLEAQEGNAGGGNCWVEVAAVICVIAAISQWWI